MAETTFQSSSTQVKITRQDVAQVLLICAFPIHAWAIVNIFWNIPSWILFQNAWGVASLSAYVLVFALFETLLAGAIVLLVGLLIPRKVLGRRLLAIAALIVLEAAVFSVAHNLDWWGNYRDLSKEYAIALGVSLVLLYLFPPLSRVLTWLAERLAVLSVLYLIFDVPAVMIVLGRNLFGY
jgi:hypothetical protein